MGAHILRPIPFRLGRIGNELTALGGIGGGDNSVIDVGVHHQTDRRPVGPRDALPGIVRDPAILSKVPRTCDK